jgi:hypothetical protein
MAFPLSTRMIALWQRPPTNITESAKQALADFAVQTRAAGTLQ